MGRNLFCKACGMAFAVAMLCSASAKAQTTVMRTDDKADFLYRIPSIVRLHDGSLMAFADKRIGHGAQDLGYGNPIDIIARRSSDGIVWGKEETVLKSDAASDGDAYAHADCASVVDRESGEIMVVNAAGHTGFFASSPIRVSRTVSGDGGRTWQTGNITSQVYQDTALARHIFFSSGRMIQSATVKVGTHYRVYAGLDTRIEASNAPKGNGGSRVVYTDDFGLSWHYLGSMAAMPAEAGDECKVEELPNGNILLSCRVANGCGRIFNVFTYSDVKSGKGLWNEPAYSGTDDVDGQTFGTSCNGELLLVPAKDTRSGQHVNVLLQSVPAANNRVNVSIYWKPLRSAADYDASSDFVNGWKRYGVSRSTSAYSTMTLTREGDVAFLYEEHAKNANAGYDIQFSRIPLAGITQGAYTFEPGSKGYFRTSAEP